MAIYELRTYTVTVGKMNDVVALYKAEGWPALSKHPQKLCGYFTGDIGALNQLRCALVPSIPEFEIGSADLRTNVQSLVATTPANYFQVLNERDDYARANAAYARDLRSLRAEYYKLRVQIAKSD